MTKNLTSSRHANPGALLNRILEQPDLVSAVQALPPASLLRLINRIGLEDAGELVALTTVNQLRRVFDEDLWHSKRPGEDERFDPARFTLWLEVMLEAGERFAADKLAELPEDLVELALHHHILVISLEELALLISEGEGQVPLEKVVEDSPYLELGDYCVIGRRHESWDAITQVLTALDERHSNALQPMLERLWRVTSDYVYGQGGLFQVLTSEEMLQADAAADREDRRERSGFVAASSARSFLSLSRSDDVASLIRAPSRDPSRPPSFATAWQHRSRSTGQKTRGPASAIPPPCWSSSTKPLETRQSRGFSDPDQKESRPGRRCWRAPSSSSPRATPTVTRSESASSATWPTCSSRAWDRGARACALSMPLRRRSRPAASASNACSPSLTTAKGRGGETRGRERARLSTSSV